MACMEGSAGTNLDVQSRTSWEPKGLAYAQEGVLPGLFA
jgi:hypothetical protein